MADFTWSLVGSTSAAGSASGVTTPAIDTRGANFIVLSMAWNDTTTTNPTITDAYGNAYELSVSRTTSTTGPTTFYENRMVKCYHPVVGVAHTWSMAGTNIFPCIQVQAWRGGTNIGPFGVPVATASGSSVSSQFGSSGAINPTAIGQLMVAGCFYLDNGGATVDINPGTPGWTITHLTPWSSTNQGGGMAYKLSESTDSTQIGWRFTNVVLRNMNVVGVFAPGARRFFY